MDWRISYGDVEGPWSVTVAFKVAGPGSVVTVIWFISGIEGSIGSGLLSKIRDATVFGCEDISIVSAYVCSGIPSNKKRQLEHEDCPILTPSLRTSSLGSSDPFSMVEEGTMSF
jgi:hypothetical protein